MKLIVLIALVAIVGSAPIGLVPNPVLNVVNSGIITINDDIPCYCEKIYLKVTRNDHWHEYTGHGYLWVDYNATIFNNTNINFISSGVVLKNQAYQYSDINQNTLLYYKGLNTVNGYGDVYVEQETDEMNQPETQYYWCFCVDIRNVDSLQVQYSLGYLYRQENKENGNYDGLIVGLTFLGALMGFGILCGLISLRDMESNKRKDFFRKAFNCMCCPCVRIYRCCHFCNEDYEEFQQFKRSKSLNEGQPILKLEVLF